jgi:ribA/ribD-fused uncharacterized protein
MIEQFRGQYRWLSNFWFSPMDIWGLKFKTNEHYFTFSKTADPEWANRIINADTPSAAKKLGQQCPVRPNWKTLRTGVMSNGLWSKFVQNPPLLEKLVATWPTRLVEGNYWHDNFWGNCLCPKCEKIEGINALGKLLMSHRETFNTVRILNQ